MRKLSLKHGDKFNMLTVCYHIPCVGKLSMWKCKCDCGKFTLVRVTDLKTGKIKSCGCNWLNSHRRTKLPREEAMENIVYDRYKLDAKKRNLSFNIPKGFFCNLIHQSCYYCGLPPSSRHNKPKLLKYYPNFLYNGIDRIDNEKGYSINNCVTCCKTCNLTKGKMSLNEYKCWIDKIYHHLFTIK